MVTTMASVKLVNSLAHHHQTYYPHHQHHPLLRPTSPPEQTMTLDYSLPHRSRSTDGDPGSDSARGELSPPLSPEGSESRDPCGTAETPTKKNKRKLSEPKKRAADFSVKRLCPSSPNLDVENVDVESEKDDLPTGGKQGKGKRLSNGHSHSKRSSSTSSSKPSSQSQGTHSKRDTPSSSSSVSNNDNDTAKDTPLPSLANGVPPHFLHPMLAGVHPSALGYPVPGLYFGGRPFPHPGLHPSFPALPLHLQHSYIAAAAAAAAQSHPSTSLAAAAATATSTSLSSLPIPGTSSSSNADSSSAIANSLKPHHTSSSNSSHPPILNLPAPPLGSSRPPSSSPSSLQPPLPSSSSKLQPSALHRPSSSRTVTSNNDDEDMLSSRAASPEDLSLGGKLSRKHRKNYKNMTRERRVEANARERTRVHTISAAFDALRHAVPSYSHNQKLSKLAILRIACSYIMALARMADLDYTSASEHIGKPLTFAECVDMCTNTIQTEGRARRRH